MLSLYQTLYHQDIMVIKHYYKLALLLAIMPLASSKKEDWQYNTGTQDPTHDPVIHTIWDREFYNNQDCQRQDQQERPEDRKCTLWIYKPVAWEKRSPAGFPDSEYNRVRFALYEPNCDVISDKGEFNARFHDYPGWAEDLFRAKRLEIHLVTGPGKPNRADNPVGNINGVEFLEKGIWSWCTQYETDGHCGRVLFSC
jgi:hypothetical protein